jgi:hypothetical protein
MNHEAVPMGGPLPEEHTLPLRISKSEKRAEHDDSVVWDATVKDYEGIEKRIALKQVKRENFATPEEMHAEKTFYRFLKDFPGFGKFVPESMYFRARMTKDAEPQLFRIQPFIEGRAVDRMTDEELYRDPEVVRQLIEFIDDALAVLKTARDEKRLTPDFRHAIERSEPLRATIGGLLADPRHSGNIFVADQKNETGQRVFFVDTAPNAEERTHKNSEIYAREVVSRLEAAHFLLWKKKLEEMLKYNLQGIRYKEGMGLVINEDVKSPNKEKE